MTQKYQVKVSMKQAAIVETGIVLKQGDFGMQLEIEVLDFDATGTTPQIVFRKAMGAVESTTITVSGNKYTYTFKGTELDTPGKVFCDLKLKNSTTQRISTASFMFKVVADTLDGLAEESSSYSDTIAQIINEVNNTIQETNSVVDNSLDGIDAFEEDGYRHITDITNGTFYAVPPQLVSLNTRIRPRRWVYVKAGDKISIKNGTIYSHAVGIWGGTPDSYQLIRNDSSFITANEDININTDGFCCIVFANKNDTTQTIDPANFDGSIIITSYITHQVEKLTKGVTEGSIVLDATSQDIFPEFETASGYYKYDGTFVTFSNILSSTLTVTEGEIYILKAKDYYEMALCAILDNSDNVIGIIWNGNDLQIVSNIKIIIPEGAAKIVLQTNINGLQDFNLIKTSKGALLTANAIQYNGDKLYDIINKSAKEEYEAQNITFTAATGYYNRNTLEFTTYSNIYKYEIDVNPGDKFILNGTAYYDMAMWVLLFNNTALFAGGFADTNFHEGIIINIPNGINKLILERRSDNKVELYKYNGYNLKPASVLKGKKITVIGDSITEYNFRAKTNWSMWIKKWAGAEVQNLGKSGTGFAKDNPYINRISAIQANPDIIGVAVSWNDMSAGLPIGTITDSGTSTLAGYANDFFDTLISNYPSTPIICYSQGVWASYHPGITTSDEWFILIQQICARKGIPFYGELYNGSVLRPWNSDNREVYYTTDNDEIGNVGESDGTHPNSEGHKVIARYLYPKFAQNIVTIGLNYN